MKMSIYSQLRVCCVDSWFIIIFFLSSLLISSAFGRVTGDKELLRLTAKTFEDNIDRISSWQGTSEVQDIFTGERKYGEQVYNNRVISHSVQFVYDRGLKATRWNWKVEDDVCGRNNINFKTHDLYYRNSMIKDEKFYEFGPMNPSYMERSYVLTINALNNKRPQILSLDFDPMEYFYVIARDVPDRLMFYYQNADKPKYANGTVKRKGDLIVFERKDKNNTIINNWTFDLSQGGNIISIYNEDSIIREEWSFTYEFISGAFVPKQVYFKNVDNRTDKAQIHERHVRFIQNTINEPVDVSEFEFEKLGVKPGDRVFDNLVGYQYKYKEPIDNEIIYDVLDDKMTDQNTVVLNETGITDSNGQVEIQKNLLNDKTYEVNVDSNNIPLPISSSQTRFMYKIISIIALSLTLFVIILLKYIKGKKRWL